LVSNGTARHRDTNTQSSLAKAVSLIRYITLDDEPARLLRGATLLCACATKSNIHGHFERKTLAKRRG
jgi:hypothetical protein